MIIAKSPLNLNQHTEHMTDLLESHQKNINTGFINQSFNLIRMQQAFGQSLLTSTPFDWFHYINDRSERAVLTLEALRESGDTFIDSETHGHKPVLEFDSDLVIDGHDLKIL